jgi:hypothetical protein
MGIVSRESERNQSTRGKSKHTFESLQVLSPPKAAHFRKCVSHPPLKWLAAFRFAVGEARSVPHRRGDFRTIGWNTFWSLWCRIKRGFTDAGFHRRPARTRLQVSLINFFAKDTKSFRLALSGNSEMSLRSGSYSKSKARKYAGDSWESFRIRLSAG